MPVVLAAGQLVEHHHADADIYRRHPAGRRHVPHHGIRQVLLQLDVGLLRQGGDDNAGLGRLETIDEENRRLDGAGL